MVTTFSLSCLRLRRLLLLLLAIAYICPLAMAVDDNTMYITGRIKESIFKRDLPNAWVWTIGQDGERVDSLPMGVYLDMLMGGENSQFTLTTNRNDSTYVFEAGCDGYTPQTVIYKVEKAKREWHREMPIIYLERAPHNLSEVTVTASKIKFYHRGDTLVYNADAFQLAEGSMLDALINQLPGAELSKDGRISINGEFVETLLLDGKPFFDGNNRLMLDNIGAYMVKNVEIYQGQTDMEKWMNIPDAPKHLTMNVKLKKEYCMGWIFNAQAGYGTEDRYLGRLFASWFTPMGRVALAASLNNLNDTRAPGGSDSWTPEQMPAGKRRYQLAGLTYSFFSPDNSRSINGDVTYEGNRLDSRTKTDRTNFLPTGNTYDYSQAFGRNKDFKLSTTHRGDLRLTDIGISAMLSGAYSKTDRSASAASASFNHEQADITMQSLQAIYSDGSDSQLESIINRSTTRSDGSTKKGNIDLSTFFRYKIPHSSDMLLASARVEYDTQKEQLWDDYNVAYGYNRDTQLPESSTIRRNFTDNSPNHNLGLEGLLGYTFRLKGMVFNIGYEYTFHNRERDSYMYALDRLADMGVYGSLPSDYISAFDPGNSFTSSLWENCHSGSAGIQYSRGLNTPKFLLIKIGAKVGALHSRLNYYSDGMFYPVRRTSCITTVASTDAVFGYTLDRTKDGGQYNDLHYQYMLDTDTPDLLHMVDVTDTSDPLNIDLGNPDLKNALRHRHSFRWSTRPASGRYNNTLLLDASHTSDALARGYAYDINTGVRYNRTYNVDGNYTLNGTNTFSLKFGRHQQFTLSSTTEAGKVHSVDMVGVIDGSVTIDPTPSKVDTRTLGERLQLTWQIGRQSLSLNGKVTDRHTSSTREGFADINATHYNYGMTGQFALPGGLGIGTDFTFYTRRGYGVRELDTTDAVWNARISYTPRGGRWVFTVDAFDLLHRLSNVSYAVTATGRTVTVTNTLPRYILASVQYRFNINPRQR